MGVAICEHCCNIVVAKHPKLDSEQHYISASGAHHSSIAALVESAETCPFCTALLQGFRHYVAKFLPRYGSELPHFAKFEIDPYWNPNYEEVALIEYGFTVKGTTVTIDGKDRSMGSGSICGPNFLIKRGNFRGNAPIFTIQYNRKVEASINLDGLTERTIWQSFGPGDDILDGRFNVIRTWIQQCQLNHPRCKLVRNVDLPTRLVKVDSGTDAVRLVDAESLGNPTAISYTALSHCWGTRPQFFCKTTRENEAKHRNKIPWDSLSKTYRDAIVATRKLGIPYIWIDSLCIIQGDPDEWQRESSRMASVFSGAVLTLAATDSEDGNAGLFLTSLEPPIETTYDEEGAPILLRCPAADNRLIQVSPLNSRAWTLQELVLSRRTVHFSTNQLYWQCKELFLSEDGLIQNDVFASFRQGYMREPLDFSKTEVALEYWWMWVKDYSARKISVGKDWVPAIAGVTEYFSQETGLTPILGMWKESLVDDLAWAVDQISSSLDANDNDTRTQDIPRRSSVLNIPSWTWLRYETPISRARTTGSVLETHAKIQDAEVYWMETPLTSQIKSTKLTISAPLKRLTFCRSQPARNFPGGIWILSGQDRPHNYSGFLDLSHNFPYSPDDYLDLGDRKEPFTELCMKLLTCQQGFGTARGPGLDSLGFFLAVREVLTEFEETRKYERIGIGRWDATPGEPDPFEGVECSIFELV
ncbi:heterokaryon incompatibility protein-domain-containing protein [Lasiosphaeria ovina]|uniref:Heterokaryon incompatibility protein-domain-containing protein n=1 Tax=Lasiosphaeria ovina TaxID=92902 RepID=A0AAE0K470_9PEZI|nr:heterokaryon incompatibility protein-domain-containing protein [Lasiosphaeria ovina]